MILPESYTPDWIREKRKSCPKSPPNPAINVTPDFFHPFLAIRYHLGLSNRISSQHISHTICFIFNLIQL